jgi:hypothetical protein
MPNYLLVPEIQISQEDTDRLPRAGATSWLWVESRRNQVHKFIRKCRHNEFRSYLFRPPIIWFNILAVIIFDECSSSDSLAIKTTFYKLHGKADSCLSRVMPFFIWEINCFVLTSCVYTIYYLSAVTQKNARLLLVNILKIFLKSL